MRKFKFTNYALLIFFAAFIWGFSLVDILTPGREYSEIENRYLAQAPAFSLRTLLNNSYTEDFETFTNDQFAGRDMWVMLKSLCETALLKTENNGIVYGKEGYMFEKRYSCDAEQLETNTRAVLDFAEKFPGQSISLMIVPTSDQILTDFVPRGLNNLDQKPLIDELYSRAQAAGINTVDAWGALLAARDKHLRNLYYRTDHHWNANGSNLIATRFANVPDFSVRSFVHAAEGFYGTYYSKAKHVFTTPDTILAYPVPVQSVTINGNPVDGLYDFSKFETRDKYAAFLHGNNGVTVIKSGEETAIQDGKKILMFKDSFGNSFAPYLCYAYDEITVVDLRYFFEVEELMAANDYDEILLLYSFPSFSQEASVVNLRL